MKRQVSYTWRLAELMAARGMHNSTELIPLLVERGIQLSRPQVYRVVHQRPERVSLQLIAALCDILSCGVGRPPHRDRRCPPAQSVVELADRAGTQRCRAQQSGASSPSQSAQR